MATLTIISAVLQPDGKTVRLTTAPQTAGPLNLTVGGVKDLAGNTVSLDHDDTQFSADLLPRLVSVSVIDKTTIDVIFNEDIDQTTMTDTTHYLITGQGTPTVSNANRQSATVVRLTTTTMASGNYSLEVIHVTDLNGNIIDGVYDTAPFEIVTLPQWGAQYVETVTTATWYACASNSDGTKLIALSYGYGIYTTTDSGAHWVQRFAAPVIYTNWTSCGSDSTGNKLIVCAASDRVYTSIDAGVTWTARTLGGVTTAQWHACASDSSGSNLIACNYGGLVYTSTDSGATWTARTLVGATTGNWMCCASNSTGSCLMAGEATTGNLYTSVDGGVNWTLRTFAIGQAWKGLAINSTGTVLVAGGSLGTGRVYVSTNSGSTWTVQAPGSVTTGSWDACTSNSDGTKLIVCNSGGRVYLSIDSGTNWVEQTLSGVTVGTWRGCASNSAGSSFVVCGTRLYVYKLDAVAPQVVSAIYVDSTHIDVNFSEALDTATAQAIEHYTISGDTSPGVSAAVCQNATTVRLTTATISGANYTAGIIHVTDPAGNVVDPNYATANFGVLSWQAATFNRNACPQQVTGFASNTSGSILVLTCQKNSSEGIVYVSTDSGVTWVNRTPSGAGVGYFTCVASDSTGLKFVAGVSSGSYSHLWTTTDSGVSWTQRDPVVSGTATWESVACDSTGTYLLACIASTVYRSANSGSTWTAQTIPGGHTQYKSVASDSDGSVLMCCSNGGNLFVSTNSGGTWAEWTLGLVDVDWECVALNNTGSVLLACIKTVGGEVAILDEGGTIWWRKRTPAGGWFNTVSCDSTGNYIIACIGASSVAGNVYVTNNKGITWTTLTSLGSRKWTSVYTNSTGSTMLAGTNLGEVFLSKDSGQTWVQTCGTSVTTNGWTDVGLNNTGQYVLACSTTSNGWYGDLFLSKDYGYSFWELEPPVGSYWPWNSVDISDDGQTIIACTAMMYNNAIYVSADGGITWLAYNPSSGQPYRSVACDSSGLYMVCCANNVGGVWYSSDRGVNWTARAPSAATAYWDVDISADGLTVIVCVNDIGTYGHVWTSHNRGVSWTEQLTSLGHLGWRGVACSANGMVLLACGGGGLAYKSVDGGPTWNALQGGLGGDWRSVACDDNGSVFVTCDHDLRLYKSIDSGTNWVAQTLPGSVTNEEWINCKVNQDGSVIIACAATDGRVYVLRDPDTTTPRVVSATATTTSTVRIVFNEMMTEASIGLKDNYSFTTCPSGATITVGSVTKINSTTVDINILGEMKTGVNNYVVTVTGVIDDAGNVINASFRTGTFSGLGSVPRVESAYFVDSLNVDVVFNEAIELTSMQTVGNYSITGVASPVISAAVRQNATTVRLTIPSTTAGDYIVTVINVVDLAGNPIGSTYNVGELSNYPYDWTAITLPNNVTVAYWKRAVVSDNTMLVAGSSGYVYLSNNNGVNWTTLSPGVLTADNWGGLGMDGNLILAAKYGGSVYLSTDKGTIFNSITFPGATTTANWTACAISGNTLLVCCDGTPYRTYISTNGGSSWTIFTYGTSEFGYWGAVAASGSTLLIGYNGGRVYQSNDNNLSWTPVTFPGPVTTGNWTSLAAHGNVLMAGNNGGKIYLSIDKGVNWSEISLPGGLTSGDWNCAAGLNTLVITNYNASGRTYISTNNGISWTAVTFPGSVTTGYWRAAGADGTTLIAGHNNNGRIYQYLGRDIVQPQLMSATSMTASTVRLIFDEPMSDTGLTTLSNYSFLVCPSTAPITVSSVTKISSTTVDIGISGEMKTGTANYTAKVINVIDAKGHVIHSTRNIATFNGLGIAPQSVGSTTLDVMRVRVGFDSVMDQVSMETAGNYTISGAAAPTVTAAIKEDSSNVNLSVPFTVAGVYNLAISNVKDVAGNIINAIYDDTSFTRTGWSDITFPGSVTTGAWTTMATSGSTFLVGNSGLLLYKSTNKGSSWAAETLPGPVTNASWSSIDASGNTWLVSVNGGRVYQSTDGCANWAAISPGGVTTADWKCVAVDGNTMMAGIKNGLMYLTTNGGSSWASVTFPGSVTTNYWYSVSISGNNIIVGAGASGQWKKAYLSIDKGSTWTTVTFPPNTTEGVWTVAVEGDVMLAGNCQSTSCYSYKSIDKGATWTILPTVGSWTGVGIAGNVLMRCASQGQPWVCTDGINWTSHQAHAYWNVITSNNNVILCGATSSGRTSIYYDSIAPRVVSAVSTSTTKIRVVFDKIMDASDLTTVTNYSITGPAEAPISVSSISIIDNWTVDVTTTGEMKIGTNNYTIKVMNMKDGSPGNTINYQYDEGIFHGQGVNPQLVGAYVYGPMRVYVLFSEPMNRSLLLTTGCYSITGSTTVNVTGVEQVDFSTVILTVDSVLNGTYTLAVVGTTDSQGNPIDLSYDEAVFSTGVSNWYTQTIHDAAIWQGSAISDDGNVMMMVPNSKVLTGYYPFISKNKGATWNYYTDVGQVQWAAASLDSDGSVWAAAGNGLTAVSNNNGVSWTTFTSGSLNNTDIVCNSDGSAIIDTYSGGYIRHSHDFGASWTTFGTSGYWSSVDFARATSGFAIACVYGNYMWKSSDHGASWTGLYGPGVQNWRSVACDNDGSNLIGCSWSLTDGHVYTSSDYGDSWIQRDPGSLGHQYWKSVASNSDGSKLIICEHSSGGDGLGRVLISTNGGVTWTAQTFPGNVQYEYWNSVSSDSTGLILTVCGRNNKAFTTIDGGITWYRQTMSPVGDSVGYWRSAASNNDGSLLMVGSHASGYSGVIALSTDGGLNWYGNSSLPQHDWTCMASDYDGSNLIACSQGTSGDAQGRVYVSSNYGLSWTSQSLAGVVSATWQSVSSNSDGTKLIVCNSGSGRVYISVNSGTTWVAQTLDGVTTANWISVASDSDGSNLIACVSGTRVFTSADSGATWVTRNPESLGDASWKCVASSGNGSVLLACVTTSGRVYLSTNSGVTWAAQTLGGGVTTGDWRSVSCSTDGQVLAATDHGGRYHLSTNGGTTWTVQSFPGSVTTKDWWASAISGNGQVRLAGVAIGKVYVFPSISAPQVVSATCIDSTHVDVTFNKVMSQTTMEDAGHYTIGGDASVAVSAAVASSATLVRLTTAAMANGNYSVGVIHVTDAVGNVVDPAYDDAAFVVDLAVYAWNEEYLATATTGDWRSVAADSDGSFLITCNHGTHPYTSADGGATWTERNPATVGDVAWWDVASDSDGSNLIACASGGRVYLSTDSGSTWTAQTLAGVTTDNWTSVASDSDGSVLMAVSTGAGGRVYLSTDSGVNWIAQTLAGVTTGTWYGASMDTDGTNLTVALMDTHIYTSADSGANWTERDPAEVGHVGWRSTATSGNGAILLACYEGATGRVYISTDSGVNWTAQTLAGVTTGDWKDVACSSDGTIMMANDHSALSYVSVDSGANWVAQTLPPAVTNEEWNGCAVSADGKVRMACAATDGRVYVYRTDAVAPQVVSATYVDSTHVDVTFNESLDKTTAETAAHYAITGDATPAVSAAACQSATVVRLTVDTMYGGDYTVTVIHVTDTAGNIVDAAHDEANFNVAYAWYAQTFPGSVTTGGWRAVASDSTGERLIACDYTKRVYITTDGGASWTETRPAGDADGNWQAVASDSTGDHLIICAYFGRVYTTTDGGANWTARTLAGVTTSDWYSCASDSTGDHLIASEYDNRVYTSTDGGANWTAQTLAGVTTGEWFGLASDSTGDHLMAVHYGDRVCTTTDGGANWTARTLAGVTTGNWQAVASDSTGDHLVAGNIGGRLYTTTDGGANWTARTLEAVTTGNWYGAASDSTGDHLMACNEGGRLYTSIDGGANWIAQTFPGSVTTGEWFKCASNSTGERLIVGDVGGRVYVYK